MSTSKQERRPQALSERALRQLIHVAMERGYYQETGHSELEHAERNISTDDVIHGLEREDWVLEEPPDYDEEHQGWEYLIRTVDIEGDELHLKIAAHPHDKRIEIVTRW
jgi:hypothetical protein